MVVDAPPTAPAAATGARSAPPATGARSTPTVPIATLRSTIGQG